MKHNIIRTCELILLSICFILLSSSCSSTIVGNTNGSDTQIPYVKVTDEMLQNSKVYSGTYADYELRGAQDEMVDLFEGGSYSLNGVEGILDLPLDELIIVSVTSRPVTIDAYALGYKKADDSVLTQFTPAISSTEYENNIQKVEAIKSLYEFLEYDYVPSLKNKAYSIEDITKTEFFVKAFKYCIESEFGVYYSVQYDYLSQPSAQDIIASHYALSKRMEKNGFYVVWDGTGAEYGAFSFLSPKIENNAIGCIIATTPRQLMDYIKAIPSDESYSFCYAPMDARDGVEVLLLKKVAEDMNISFLGECVSVDDYFSLIVSSSATPEKYTDGNIFCLTADSPGMNQTLYEQLMSIKQEFISAGLIK